MNLTIAQRQLLLDAFPFLRPRNLWTGKLIEDCDWIVGEGLPQGWLRLFLMYCKNLKLHLVATNTLDTFRFTDVKEKYGRLCLYNHGEPESAEFLTILYERYSAHVCLQCGKPATYTTKGWIMPVCEQCLNTTTMLPYEVEKLPKTKELRVSMYTCGTSRNVKISMRHLERQYLKALSMTEEEFINYITK